MSGIQTKIRISESDDLPAITEIYSHYVRTSLATFETEPPSRSEMERRWSALMLRGLPYLVSELNYRVVGYAYVSHYRARHAYRFSVENSVYVHPEYLKNGIGRQLLETLLSNCEGKGFRQMIAVIGDSANLASIRLHEKLQFRQVGVLKKVGFKFEQWVDTVLMQRPIVSAAQVDESM
jgi:L-amino acid N-acyltransferase YncA